MVNILAGLIAYALQPKKPSIARYCQAIIDL
jgi:hypothetical protein